MRRNCGCRVDPIVFGHTECEYAPAWVAALARARFWWKPG